jgi:hypothetical protein
MILEIVMAMAILEKQTTRKHFLSSLRRKLTVIEAKNENLKNVPCSHYGPSEFTSFQIIVISKCAEQSLDGVASE